MTYVTVDESYRQPNNVLFKVGPGSDTESTDSFHGGSRRTTVTSTSGDTSTEPRQGHYRGITFEDILPPQFISNAPPLMVEHSKRGIRHPKPADADGPPSATSLRSEPSVKRSYPSAKHSDSGKSSGGGGSGGGKSRIRSTARALVRGLTMKKRDSQGYEAV